jgi:hypothetical protein
MMFGVSFSLLPLEGGAFLRADFPVFRRDFDFGFDLALMNQASSIIRRCGQRMVSQVCWSVGLSLFISFKESLLHPP